MKKVIAIFSVLALVITLGACSSNDSSGNSSKNSNAQSDGESKDSGKTYKIKLGHTDKTGDDSITDWTARKFVELAEKYSDGRLKFKIYPSNQLGSPKEQMRATQSGTQEMSQGSVNNLSQLAPSLNYLTLPYLFTSKDDARNALDKLWDKNNEILKKQANMRTLVWTTAGPRVMTSNEDHPVRTLDDLKDFKMRLPQSKISEKAFKAFGAQVVTLPFDEVFTGLQQGTADGQENAVTTARTEHYYEAQKYITNLNWQWTISTFNISEKYFQSLPEDLQDALVKAGKETTKLERKRFDKMNEDDVKFLKKKGMEFLGKPEDFDKWVEKGRSTWDSHYKLIGNGDAKKGKELVEEVKETIK